MSTVCPSDWRPSAASTTSLSAPPDGVVGSVSYNKSKEH